MNPQYLPPQFGGPPQGKQDPDMLSGSSKSFGPAQPPPGNYMPMPSQMPYGYKGQMGPSNAQSSNTMASLPNQLAHGPSTLPPGQPPQMSMPFNAPPSQMRPVMSTGIPAPGPPVQNGLAANPPSPALQRQIPPSSQMMPSMPSSTPPASVGPSPASGLPLPSSGARLPPLGPTGPPPLAMNTSGLSPSSNMSTSGLPAPSSSAGVLPLGPMGPSNPQMGIPSSVSSSIGPPLSQGAGIVPPNYPPQGQLPSTKAPIMPNMNPMMPPPVNQIPPRNMPGPYLQQKPSGSGYPGMPPPAAPSGQLPSNVNQPYNPTMMGSAYPPQPQPNQLINQMSDLHLSGNRQQYPPKPAMNGENLSHMPPPLSQNGAQNRSSQAPMGYPPMPGQQQMPTGPYPPQQARRLDPDQMPSPIQVTLDDQKTRSGVFSTNQKGLVPPLVSTNYITHDQGNAGPRFIRSTMYNVPTTSDMMKQTAVPFGLVISPLARTLDQEYPPPIVDFGELGPVRCIRCKAYMSPFMQFIDSGRRFQCLFCKATTEVPTEYFQHLDHTGQRVDRYERPELLLGTYEFVATKDYCRNNTFPKTPALIFVIDVSYNNVKSGLVHLLCAEMKEILKHLPIDQNQEKTKMKVGFITYNSTVHFYNIKGTLAQPQMMVVGDVQEMFMPLLDGFLCDIEDSAGVIDSLMEQIPTMFAETRETETVLLPAIQAGLEALKASECAGKLLVFHSTLPTSEAPGRLKNRDERKLLGTDKERTVLTPQTQVYNQLGQDCVQVGCSVDLFITNNSYIDLATIGQISRLTGGEIFKYTYFQADVDGHRLINDIITDISRPVAFDTVMRVRTSTGVRPTDFYGHFFMSNTTDMEIAAIDCDKAVAVEIKHDDKLTEEEGIYIQVALLYTSCAGQRRLRILNLSLKTCGQMADLYRSCELDTIVNFFAKQSVYRLLENNPKSVKDSLVNRCAQMLACYRKNCASPSSAGQLILPECMKLLPLYVNCLLKSDAISGGSDMTLDDRSFVMQSVTTMDIPTSVVYFYPRLIPLHEIQNGSETPEIPNAIRCTIEKMAENGVYLLENGIHMMVWIGLNANQEWIQNVFGVPSAAQVDVDRLQLPEIDNSLSIAVRNLLEQIRAQRHRCMRLTIVKQRDKLETVFRHFLVEDRGQDGSSSYVDFLCHMHKEIRQLLS